MSPVSRLRLFRQAMDTSKRLSINPCATQPRPLPSDKLSFRGESAAKTHPSFLFAKQHCYKTRYFTQFYPLTAATSPFCVPTSVLNTIPLKKQGAKIRKHTLNLTLYLTILAGSRPLAKFLQVLV